MAYTRVMCASMHVLFLVRKFLLCAIAFASGKLRVVLKLADQSRAGSHFNSQNTHSQFRNSQLAFYPCPGYYRISRHTELHENTYVSNNLESSFEGLLSIVYISFVLERLACAPFKIETTSDFVYGPLI